MLDDSILSVLQDALDAQEETGLTVTHEGAEEVHLEGHLNLRELAAVIAPAIDAQVSQVLNAVREGLEGPEGLALELEPSDESDDAVEIDDHVDLRQLAETMAGILTPDEDDLGEE